MANENQDAFHRPPEQNRQARTEEPETQAHSDGDWTPSVSPKADLDESQFARPIRDLIRKVRALQPSAMDPGGSDVATVPPKAAETAPPTELELSATVPTRIGRFQIEKLLGRGGFGLVFAAMDPELERRVALKVPRLETFASAEGQRRFLREARAAAILGHPNIVPIFEAGNAGPVLYMTMELVEGPTLGQWIQSHHNSMSASEIARLVSTLANGVQHAHSRGVIHRDLKPSNILLRLTQNETSIPAQELTNRAKISDFGMAQVATADGLHTQTGALVGTPAYMAPEQVRSSRDQIGPSTDVYGLGAILYELMTGQPPFSGETFGEIIRSVEERVPTPPSRLGTKTPPDLEAICLKCLEKSSAHRYGSASELAEDLERFLAGQTIRARRIGALEKLLRWSLRNRAIAAALTFAFFALAGGLAIAINQASRAHRNYLESEHQKSLVVQSLGELGKQKQLTESNFELALAQRLRAERHLERAEKVIDQMLNDVAVTLAPIPRMAPIRTAILKKALEFENELAAEESDDPDSQIRAAEAQGRVGEIQIKLGLVTDALQSLEMTAQRLDNIVPNSDEQRTTISDLRIKTQLFLARVYSLQGNHRKCEELVQPIASALANEDRTQLTSDKVRSYSNALNLLARSQYRQNRFDQAELTFFTAIELLSSVPVDSQTVADRTDVAMAHSSLANLYRAKGDLSRSIESYELAIQQMTLLVKEFPDQLPVRSSLLLAQGNLASAHLEMGEHRKAYESAQAAMPEADRLIADFPEIVLHHELKLMLLASRSAAFSNFSDDVDRASDLFSETITFGEEMIRRFEPSASALETLSQANANLAYLFRDIKNEPALAQFHFEQQSTTARQLIEKFPTQTSHRYILSQALGNLGESQLQQGELTLAENSFRAALEQGRISFNGSPGNAKYHNQIARLQAHLCLTLFRLNRVADALASADEIAAIDRESSDTWLEAARSIAQGLDSLRESKDSGAFQAALEPCLPQLLQHLNRAIDLGERRRDMIKDIGQRAGIADHASFADVLSRLD